MACDPDMRQVLMGNVVLAGGGSLLAGLAERLNNELVRNFPHVKIHAPGNPAERRYGSWLGGSILASLGTFHQLWISREEWQVSLGRCSAERINRSIRANFGPRSMASLSLLSDVNKPAVCCLSYFFPVSSQLRIKSTDTFLSHFPTDLRDIHPPEPGIKGPGQK